jgi:2-keto-4-pentenoate hydratase/2-oxohepta-3-ene-1,7-dioic acid hydratase in catechol pathway
MRIAMVLHDASPEPDGAPLFPTVALERDGALYRVSALARAFGPRYARLEDEADFHHTVVSLGAEPLRELDERLKAGERPSSARILPGTFTWLPPCDPQRATFVTCAPHAETPPPSPPAFRIGSARVLFGHEATVPIAPVAPSPEAVAAHDRSGGAHDVDGSLAVVLGDDLSCADVTEAERAILGYTLLLAWRPGFGAQLGPVLVTRDEVGAASSLRTLFKLGGATLATEDVGAWSFSPAEAVAWISHHVPLLAGDVIGAGRIRGGSASDAGATLSFGMRVELAIERIGRLAGRSVEGPSPRAWRR